MAAIETIRIKDIPTTATTAAADDYIVIDGATNKVRKGLASNLITPASHNAAPAAHGGTVANVKMYGATGDGVTDDSAAFHAALAANQRVFVPSGIYNLNSSPILASGQSLIGAGRQSTVLSVASGVAGIEIRGASSRVKVEGLTITYMLRNGGTKESASASIGVSLVHLDDVNESPREIVLDELYIRGAYVGVSIAKRSFMISIRQVHVVSCRDRAFICDSATGGAPTTISLINAYANDSGGIYFKGVSKLSIIACSVDSSVISGYSGSSLLHFQSCTGCIDTLGIESNTHSAANAGMVQFDGSRMTVACLESWANTLSLASGETYMVRASSNSVITFISGAIGASRNDVRSGGASFFTVLASNATAVIFDGFTYSALGGSGGSSASDSSGFADGYVLVGNNSRAQSLRWGKSAARDHYGAGSPEGVVAAGIGSTYRRTDGGAGTSFYVKESGTGNAGWVAK